MRHSDFIVSQGPHLAGGGMHKVYRYPNGFGASVVFFQYSYGYEIGLWEAAPIKFTGDGNDDWEFTDEVVGYLTDQRLDELLDGIAGKTVPLTTTWWLTTKEHRATVEAHPKRRKNDKKGAEGASGIPKWDLKYLSDDQE